MITSEHAPPPHTDLRHSGHAGLSQSQECNHSRYSRDRDGQFCPDCNEVMTDFNS